MPPNRMTAVLHWPLAMVLLVFALVLGGGQGGLGDVLSQWLALALIGIVLWRHAHDASMQLPPVAWLALLPLCVPLLQLLPWPESLWGAAPARLQLAGELASAGVAPERRWTLVPLATERAGLWMLPAVALFLATLQFNVVQRRRLVLIVLGFALVSVFLGAAQQAGGADSALRLYSVTNTQSAVGFFANRNHFAGLLALALPLALLSTVQAMEAADDTDTNHYLRGLVGIGVCALLILGVALAASRAALLLAPLGVLLALPAAAALRRRRGTHRMLALALLAGGILAIQFGLFRVAQRLDEDVLADSRLEFAPVVLAESRQHAPLGTGLGGFRRAFEAAQGESPMPGLYVNHAHNDALELWLEAGWLLVPVALPLLAFFAWSGWRAWRGDPDDEPYARALRRIAWISVLLVLMHSLGDYPLRTTAHLALLGLLLACTMPVARGGALEARGMHAR